jgi:hypothetical protein
MLAVEANLSIFKGRYVSWRHGILVHMKKGRAKSEKKMYHERGTVWKGVAAAM